MSDREMTELAVSIQAADARSEPWRGHLAAGLLLDEGTVLVPDPPGRLVDGSVTVDVVLIPLPASVERRVERIRPDRLDLLRGERSASAAVIRLSHPTRYPPSRPGYDGCALDEALRRTGDLWAALVEIGAADEAARLGPPEDVLRQLPDLELRQWRDRVRTHDLAAGNPIGNWICFFSPRCDPCPRTP